MLKSIKAIFENATEKDIQRQEFQKYIRLLLRQDKAFCLCCRRVKEGRYMAISHFYCYECILNFNEE